MLGRRVVVTELPEDVLVALLHVTSWCQSQCGPGQLLENQGLKEWSRLNLLSAATLLQIAHEPAGVVHAEVRDVTGDGR